MGVFDTTTNKLRFAPVTVDRRLEAAAFVGADRRLAMAVYDDASVVLLGSADGTELATAPGPGPDYDTSRRPGLGLAVVGDAVVAGTSDPPQLRVLDGRSLTVRRVIDLPAGFPAVVVDAGAGTVVAASAAGIACVDIVDGGVRWAVAVPDVCQAVAVDPSRDRLYCGTAFGRLEERSLRSGELLRRLDAQHGNTGSLWLSGGDELVAFGVNEPVVLRWRLDGSGPVTAIVAPGFAPVMFSPDGDQIIVNRGSIADGSYESRLLDAERGGFVRNLAPLFGEMFSEDGSIGGVVLDARSGAVELARVDPAGSFERTGVRLDPVPLHAEAQAGGKERVLLVYERSDGEPGHELRILDPSTFELGPPIVVGANNSLSASSDGRRIAVGTADGKGVEMYDSSTGELVDLIAGDAGGVHHRRGPAVRVVARRQALVQHDLDTLEQVRTFAGQRGFTQDVQGTADGRLVMASGGDRSVSVYDVATGLRLGTPITIADGAANHAVLSLDGTKLAVEGPEGVLVWTSIRRDGWWPPATWQAGT